MRRLSSGPVAAFIVACALSTTLQAAEPPTAAVASVDSEAALDESLKGFGFLSGLARGCVAVEQQAKLEREVLDLSATIARLLGSDRAFLYASGFGYGTATETKTEDCAEVLRRYEQRVAKFRAGQGQGR